MTTINKLLKLTGKVFFLAAAMANAHAAVTDISQGPLVTSSSSTLAVKPNVFLMMDDSGSMAWMHMPDDAGDAGSSVPMSYGYYGFRSNQCNGVYYHPTITYTAPAKADGTSYADASFTTGALKDGYNSGSGSVDLRTGYMATDSSTSGVSSGILDTTGVTGYYYEYIGSQTTENLKNYYVSTSTFFKECSSANNASPGNAAFYRVNLVSTASTNFTVTITGTGTASTPYSSVTGITANGFQIMKAPSATASGIIGALMATNIATQINACTTSISGNCTVAGYSASVSSGVLTIIPPASAAAYLPVLAFTNPGTLAFTVTDPIPAHLTNFANWYSFYRSRLNMMKTATGLSFNKICPVSTPAKTCNFRVGMATMNNNGGADFLNPDVFTDTTSPVSTQRTAFYAMLYGTKAANSTPLLQALSKAGLMYSYKLPSNKLNTVTAKDPIQYSCQQNFTILSTDGFWNDATNTTITSNGSGKKCSPSAGSSSTAVGSCDSWPDEVRPQMDGYTSTVSVATPTTTVVRATTVTPTTTTTPWTRTITTVGAAASCTLTAATTPSGTTPAPMTDNSTYKIALGLSATNPDTTTPADCVSLGSNAWICRGKTSGTNPVVSLASVTDASGTPWYLVSSGSILGSTCTTDKTAWGSSYSSKKGACPGTNAVMGYQVTTQNQSAPETTTGTSSRVYDTSTTITSTISTVNGQTGAAVVTTTAGPTSTLVSGPVVVSNITDTGTPLATAYTNTGTVPTTLSCQATGTPGTTVTTGPTKNTGASTTVNGTPYTAASPAPVSTVTVGTATTSNSTSGGTSDTLADVAEYYYATDLRTATLGNCTSASSNNTLCTTPDPAPALDPLNNVPSSGLDSATWQHMTTFTLGLGARGRMVFSPTYLTDTTGDYPAVLFGSLAAAADNTTTPPTPAVCPWQAVGTACNWPIPNVSGVPENIDDLWHAAVNGRGTYFNATNPASLSTGLTNALAGVSARTGSAASASISNPNISSGDNFIFSSNFVTYDWYGHLVRQQLNVTTGALSSVIDWDAGILLDTNTARNIYAFSTSATNHLIPFNSANFGSSLYFATANISSLAQFCVTGVNCLTPAQQTAATGANLVSYLTGDRTNEGYPADLTKYYRQRLHLLGDIVDSQAAYVKSPLLLYQDTGYSDFVKAKANRQSMIYVGANDGMLHAFYANSDLMDNLTGDVVATGGTSVAGGQEAWAFIPTAVMPNLYKLASTDYASNHQYYVDGSPLTTDICPTAPSTDCTGTTWKTILVGGLNGGGNSYFAMDITNPANPIALWEFTNANMGYSYGNPQVVKLGGTATTGPLAAGTWVVLLTSGYNNADGIGHLFVLNAYTGAKLMDIKTGVGSPGSPSGLSKIIAQVVNPSLDATLMRVYGGDLFGNLWRFDINGDLGTAGSAQLLAVLQGPTGLTQPITSKPEVGIVNGKSVVYVGTGRYLGLSDINGTDTTQLSPNLQTMYGIMDPLTTTAFPSSVAIYPNPRTYGLPTPAGGPTFVQQFEYTMLCPPGAPATICSYGQIVRSSTNNAVKIGTVNSGWYVDFPDSGERLNTDPALELGILAFNTNVPSASACTIGGNSYNYILDYNSGSYISTSVVTITAAYAATLPAGSYTTHPDGTITMGIVAGQHTGSLSTAPIFIGLPSGNKALCTNDSTGLLVCRPVNPPPPSGGARRVSWRELFSQ